jgi:hypothetical protein
LLVEEKEAYRPHKIDTREWISMPGQSKCPHAVMIHTNTMICLEIRAGFSTKPPGLDHVWKLLSLFFDNEHVIQWKNAVFQTPTNPPTASHKISSVCPVTSMRTTEESSDESLTGPYFYFLGGGAIGQWQVTRAAWMLDQEKSPVGGGILADACGTGKTTTLITTLWNASLAAGRNPAHIHRPTLIVCPSVLDVVTILLFQGSPPPMTTNLLRLRMARRKNHASEL